MPKGTNDKVLAQNRKASHDYTILETIEAGMVLTGTEIKSVRQARINLKDGYVSLKQGEAFLVGVHISPFEQGTLFNHDPLRTRKLLLHKKANQLFTRTSKASRKYGSAAEGLHKKWRCEVVNRSCEREEKLRQNVMP